ncbi:MAG: hypothetical protein GXZ19_01190 [Bacteroidales bacterium]|nr:hypothetical protein [Bacteroidales bacterium]
MVNERAGFREKTRMRIAELDIYTIPEHYWYRKNDCPRRVENLFNNDCAKSFGSGYICTQIKDNIKPIILCENVYLFCFFLHRRLSYQHSKSPHSH